MMPRPSAIHVQIPLDTAQAVLAVAKSRSLHNPLTEAQLAAIKFVESQVERAKLNFLRGREDD